MKAIETRKFRKACEIRQIFSVMWYYCKINYFIRMNKNGYTLIEK